MWLGRFYNTHTYIHTSVQRLDYECQLVFQSMFRRCSRSKAKIARVGGAIWMTWACLCACVGNPMTFNISRGTLARLRHRIAVADDELDIRVGMNGWQVESLCQKRETRNQNKIVRLISP